MFFVALVAVFCWGTFAGVVSFLKSYLRIFIDYQQLQYFE